MAHAESSDEEPTIEDDERHRQEHVGNRVEDDGVERAGKARPALLECAPK